MASKKVAIGLAALVGGAIGAFGVKIVDDHIVHIGYMARVPRSEWVDVKNIKPIRDEGTWRNPVSYGDYCRIDFGGDLFVLRFIGDKAEVVYSARDKWDGGTECPNGVRTTIELGHLVTMNDDYRAKVKQIMSE